MSERGYQYFRTLVSGKKKRFVQDGFNLDLSYITERIIAMGYPADTNIHKLFRNDISHVYDFFETYHTGHWKILNVAQEISYSHTKLGGNVVIKAFEDHSPPPFALLLEIMDWMHQYLTIDPLNVIAVHCKAGKGRTGTIICAYLIYMLKMNCPEVFQTSDSVLTNTVSFFNSMRSTGNDCVTVPSQKRYIGYYISYLRGQISPSLIINPPVYRMTFIEICSTISYVSITSIEIHKRYNPTFKSLPLILHKNNTNTVGNYLYNRFEPNQLTIDGDTLLKFNTLDSNQCLCRLVFNTAFVQPPDFPVTNQTTLIFSKFILDGPSHGALEDSRFKDDFQINIHLEALFQPNIPNPSHPQMSRQTSDLYHLPIDTNGINTTTITNNNNNNHQNNTFNNNNPPPIPDRSKKPNLTML